MNTSLSSLRSISLFLCLYLITFLPTVHAQNQKAIKTTEFYSDFDKLTEKTASSKPHQSHNNVAFYYAPNIPVYELAHFDEVVVQAKNCTKKERLYLQKQGVSVFAYLSMGEIEKDVALDESIPKDWFIGFNHTWQSNVVDLNNKNWQQWILERAKKLQNLGYDGIFLDTLDSYNLLTGSNEQKKAQKLALIKTIKILNKELPELKLHLNRGFDLIPALEGVVHAVSVETLFQAWSETNKKFYPVKEHDTNWLLNKLREVQARNISINVIDYVKPTNTKLSKETANKIAALGFTPWVSVPALNTIGQSKLSIIARKVLVLFDSQHSTLEMHPAHTLLGAVFDYLGLRVEYHDVQESSPSFETDTSYAGVVSYLSYSGYQHFAALEQWLIEQKERDTPIVFFDSFPFSSKAFLKAFSLGLQTGITKPLSIKHQEKGVGDFEIPVNIRQPNSVRVFSKGAKQNVLLKIKDAENKEIDPVLIASWGGLALAPYSSSQIKPGITSWVTDPVWFFSSAFKLKQLPVADVTTENGNRILTSHIDGDGFASKAELSGQPFSAEVIYQEVLTKYKIPHTVSVIEGEVGKSGLYPHLSEQLEAIARKIFKLDHIEAASHSFSHPFVWQPEKYRDKVSDTYGVSLNIPNYKHNNEREILGSINYINSNLLPKGKRVKAFLWTGDALPNAEALSMLEELEVSNLNGANTKLTKAYPSTSQVYPQSRMTEGGLQVYAPIMNENIYSNDWSGPYYGFNKVKETIDLTGYPRRYKPISVYWHFYSGTKLASLMALHDTYRWVLKIPHTALSISEYSARVEGAYEVSFAKTIDGKILVTGLGELRTLRIPESLGYPDVSKSDGVAGYTEDNTGRYIHLSKPKASILFSEQERNTLPTLVSANAKLAHWEYSSEGTRISFKGYESLNFTIRSKTQCTLHTKDKVIAGKQLHGTLKFQLNQRGIRNALLVC